MKRISGHIADLFSGNFHDGELLIGDDGRISGITGCSDGANVDDVYILPGFIDSHIHIESSMLTPLEFAREAVRHGTVAALCDPHEIANVCGLPGIEFMLESAASTTFRFYFGVPSCVPATSFETSGASFTSEDIRKLLARDDIHFMAEMMNYPGVISRDKKTMDIIGEALASGKPIDGHAPGLTGPDLAIYASAGITTEHECTTLEEALAKIDAGICIQIREGSAARNFESLYPLLLSHPDRVMFCSDDKHPDDLVEGHINVLVRRAVARGCPVMDVLRAASLNPVLHYRIDAGLLRPGDNADFIIVDNLKDFNITGTYIGGRCVYSGYSNEFPEWSGQPGLSCRTTFRSNHVTENDIRFIPREDIADVIVAGDRQLYTSWDKDRVQAGKPVGPDIRTDRLKLVVCNRYRPAAPAVAFIRGFGLQSGAIASSVSHDSHNIIAAGTCDADIVSCINAIISSGGGIAVSDSGKVDILELPVAGLMSEAPAAEVAQRYAELNSKVISMGCRMKAPFMTLSFMALPVIPRLKLTDKGLFDVDSFRFCRA